jgi:hypothetical protein
MLWTPDPIPKEGYENPIFLPAANIGLLAPGAFKVHWQMLACATIVFRAH